MNSPIDQNSEAWQSAQHDAEAEALAPRSKREVSPSQLLAQIYNAQETASRRRGHPPPSYSQAQLIRQYVSDPEFLRLYQAWVDSGRVTEYRPSLDRRDDSQGYHFENLQITTWQQNRERGLAARRKPIAVFLNGEHLADCASTADAIKLTRHQSYIIRRHLESGTATAKGYSFRYL